MSRAVYVGTLVAIQLHGDEPIDVTPVILGVDPEIGLVQAKTRRDLSRGNYMEPPARARGSKCERLWYERQRKEFPNDRLWFHDLEDARAIFVAPLDKRRRSPDRGTSEATPLVIITGPDVETCPDPPGDFLCG